MFAHLLRFGQRRGSALRSLGSDLVTVTLIVAALISTSVAKGQETPADSIRHQPYQVGVSASSVFKLLEEGTPDRQYQVYGRYWMSSRRMSRVALRYRQVVGGNAEADVGLRGGHAWVFRGEDRWRFYGGGDLIFGYRRFANGRVSYRGGVSPLFGALLFIGTHVSLSLEPRLVATYIHSRGGDSGRSSSNVVSIEIQEAALLILSVHF